MEQLCQQILAAALRDDVYAAVRGLYRRVSAEVDARKPRCDLSGRCCRFEEYGHRLYVTPIEMAAFVRDLRERGGASSSWDGTGCPFQRGKLCTVHELRPFGCRMFYCDPSAAAWQQAAYERFHAQIKALHVQLGVPYAYLEWRAALALLNLPSGGPTGATDLPSAPAGVLGVARRQSSL